MSDASSPPDDGFSMAFLPPPPGSDATATFSVRLDEEMAEGLYANLVMVAHSPEEFVLDFIRMLPGMPQGRVVSRLVVTPAHAKRLLGTLAENVGRYEQVFGEIRDPIPLGEGEAGGPPFGGFGGATGGQA